LTAFVLLLISWIGPVQAGEVSRDRTFLSQALAGPMRYSLYLPDAYREQADARFPVVYLLHGYGADNNEWLDFGRADETFDRLIASGQIPPFIAVMPYAEKSWSVDSASLGGPGDYETAIVRDLAAHIEANYRATPERRARFIAGLSMGGYGAMRFAFFHPDRFQAAATLSGALFEDVGIPSFAGRVETGDADMQEQADFWFLGAYGRPFDAGIFLERNPFSRIGELGGGAPEILIMSGSDDFFGFHKGSAALHAALKRAGIESELLIEDGGHEWELWRAQFPHVMQFLARALEKADASSGR
jgi:enterochelin esterase family protein